MQEPAGGSRFLGTGTPARILDAWERLTRWDSGILRYVEPARVAGSTTSLPIVSEVNSIFAEDQLRRFHFQCLTENQLE